MLTSGNYKRVIDAIIKITGEKREDPYAYENELSKETGMQMNDIRPYLTRLVKSSVIFEMPTKKSKIGGSIGMQLELNCPQKYEVNEMKLKEMLESIPK